MKFKLRVIMNILDKISAYGHPLVKCIHRTTIEITKDSHLTERGTCILGINASKSCYDLNVNLKERIKCGCEIRVTIKVDDLIETFIGYGHEKLNLKSQVDMVFRRSNYICDRTVLINCTKSSRDFNRDLVERLKDSNKKFLIIFQELKSAEN